MQNVTENPLFLIPVITGSIFMAAGILTALFPPRSINMLYGYRTDRSMKSQELWDTAQRLASRYMTISGLLLAGSGLVAGLTGVQTGYDVAISIGLVLAAAFIPVALVERRLKYFSDKTTKG